MVKQMQRFALRRKETSGGTCSLASLARTFAGPAGSDARFNVRRMMLAILAQNSFRFQPGR